MKRGKRSILIGIFILIFSVSIVYSVTEAESKGKLIIFHAGSLTIPFSKMEKEFEKMHPQVDILREPAGSRRCARKITDLKRPCDIMASADYTVIDQLLIPEYANWNVRFATNRLVLCYTKKSRYSDEINSRNWFKILMRRDVVWGHSDPDADPCGYRTLLLLKLAEIYYKVPGLYKRLISNRPKENIRPKSVELIALLQTGNMDYAWEYRSVAVQHGLKFIELPDQIDLGNYRFDDFYSKAVVEISGKRPGQVIKKRGKSCTYGITILKDAPNRDDAISFLRYLLNPNGGLKILDELGQPPFVPARVATLEMKKLLPLPLRRLVEVKD
ncbi:MAG TPA: tungstate ABC transporter substrate-binding protein WtpA [Desulfobacteraceae bacterium]|nr:tungstate ABC transporter substrate-binding protein WtpA [Desulfobacteraceae bacterium]